MRIYMIGPVAAGKSTLASRLGNRTGIPVYHLDELVHIRDDTPPFGNRRRPEAERDQLFQDILCRPDWIMEDTGRICFSEGLSAADTIVLLEPPTLARYYRILSRFVKQQLNLEPCNYAPNLHMLKAMFRWTREYHPAEIRQKLQAQNKTVVILRSSKAAAQWLQSV